MEPGFHQCKRPIGDILRHISMSHNHVEDQKSKTNPNFHILGISELKCGFNLLGMNEGIRMVVQVKSWLKYPIYCQP